MIKMDCRAVSFLLCCDWIGIAHSPQNLRNSGIPAASIWSYFGCFGITRIWLQWQVFVITIIWWPQYLAILLRCLGHWCKCFVSQVSIISGSYVSGITEKKAFNQNHNNQINFRYLSSVTLSTAIHILSHVWGGEERVLRNKWGGLDLKNSFHHGNWTLEEC